MTATQRRKVKHAVDKSRRAVLEDSLKGTGYPYRRRRKRGAA